MLHNFTKRVRYVVAQCEKIENLLSPKKYLVKLSVEIYHLKIFRETGFISVVIDDAY